MAAVAAAFAVGILLAELLGWASCVLFALCTAILGLIFLGSNSRTAVVLLSLMLLSGGLRYAADRRIAPDDISRFVDRISAVEGTVASDITGSRQAARFVLSATRAKCPEGWQNVSGRLMTAVYCGQESIGESTYGDRLRIRVRPYLPPEQTNPGQFSYKTYLARHGVYACASVREEADLELLRSSRARGLRAMPGRAKKSLLHSISHIHPPRQASVISGIVLGSYAFVDGEIRTDFERTGTLHVLAASGYNCFVIIFLASPVLAWLWIPAMQRRYVIIGLIGFYLLMVGPTPSLVRAGIMATLVLLQAPLRRAAHYPNLLFVAALLVLLVNPSNLFDVGFQLSFLSVGALVYVTPLLETILERLRPLDKATFGWNRPVGRIASQARKVNAWVKSTLAATAVATIAVSLVTAPVVAYYFNYLSLTSLPANLVVALTTPIIFLDSFLSPVLSLLPGVAHHAGWIGTGATTTMLWSLDYLGAMRYSSVPVQSPGVPAIAGYYIMLCAGAGYVRSRFAKG